MKKLPKAFKTKWLKALRSGKFKQARRQLRENGKYCCLGVAVAVHSAKYAKSSQNDYRSEPTKNSVPRGVLPALNQLIPETYDSESPMGVLINLNDSEDWSFKRIATWIEKNL